MFDLSNSAGDEKFVVNNFEDSYGGSRTLGSALTVSDNAVYAAAGLKVGPRRVSDLIESMGVRTPVSTNPAMTLGAFKRGVSVLDWAHAYESFATGGKRISGSLGAPDDGPVGIREVRRLGGDGKLLARNERRSERVLSPQVAAMTTAQMQTVVASGTGKRAAYGGFAAGKTGTTENFGDAWFVGFTRELTIAVWVGYPDATRPMKTEFGGEPVAGGTFPALIWRDFVVQAKAVFERRIAEREAKRRGDDAPDDSDPASRLIDGSGGAPDSPGQSDSAAADGGDSPDGKKRKSGSGGERKPPAPAKQPSPAPAPTPAPTPAPAPAPSPAPAPAPAPAPGGGSGGISAPPG